MKAEIKVPAVGESISEATIGEWTKKSGEFVKRDEVILVLETDKASVEVVAPNDGVLTTSVKAGDVVKIGSVVASIDTEGVATAGMPAPGGQKAALESAPASAPAAPAAPAPTASMSVAGSAAVSASSGRDIAPELKGHLSPAVRRVVDERGLDPAQILGSGKDGRLTKADVEAARAPSGLGAMSAGAATIPGGNGAPSARPSSDAKPAAGSSSGKASQPIPPLPTASRAAAHEIKRVPMTTIRKRIAERLVQAQRTAAILTTFNEVDMTQVMAFRDRYKDKYKEKYGVSLGFMGFFVKAAVEGLKEIPGVNASIEGSDVLYKSFYNVGVAVSTEKGLVVPVIRDADQLSIAEIEQSIRHYALKARDGKLTVDDLSDGTFTISNGGVFGSLMSTPILNPPQSGILGMHKVQERPVAIGGKVEIRPMMYVALSYDHRMIDGREAVTFLVRIKECIENPERILLNI